MSWLWFSLALATCPGEAVEIDGQTYFYQEDGGCGNGRWAECSSDHSLSTGPACERFWFREHFGGGTSTRYATMGAAPGSVQAWFLRKVGATERGEGPADLLAHDASPLSPVGQGPRSSQTTRWLSGAPGTPRISWAATSCRGFDGDAQEGEHTCYRIFRGDQVTPLRVDVLDEHTALHVIGNAWRNRRVFYVLHDRRGDRHAFLAEVMVPSLTLPAVVGRLGDGLVLTRTNMGSSLVFEWIRPDGSYTVVEGTGVGEVLQGQGWVSEATGQLRSWSDMFEGEGVPSP